MTPDGRRPLVAGNWKMYGRAGTTATYVERLLGFLGDDGAVEVAVCVPFTALAVAVEAASGSRLLVAAQNMHQEDEGAFTGEVSPAMLVEIGVGAVVLGHSERRLHAGETDRALADKVPAALAAGLLPILCVGESEEEREAGDTQRRLRYQVQEGLEKVPTERLAEVVVAYEPIWAIGTGLVAAPEEADEAMAFVRALVGDRSKEAAQALRVLYGGSVKPENAGEILAQPNVDGALVGGASLDPKSLAEIARAARR